MTPIPFWLIIRSAHATARTRTVVFIRQEAPPVLSPYDYGCVDGPFHGLEAAQVAREQWLASPYSNPTLSI